APAPRAGRRGGTWTVPARFDLPPTRDKSTVWTSCLQRRHSREARTGRIRRRRPTERGTRDGRQWTVGDERMIMTGVRVLVGTRKGAFTLTSDGTRRDWTIEGPHFAGWQVYHLAGSPADPDRIYAAP